jgi:hypothetical protein
LPTSLAAPLAVLAAAALAGIGAWLASSAARDPRVVARRVEAEYPELRTCLLAAVEQKPELPGGRFGYLQASVIRQALSHAQRHPWAEIVSQKSIVLAALANCLAMLIFAIALAAVVFTVARPVANAAAALAGRGLGELGSGFAVVVEPGDAEVERGTSVMVLARVTGRMPADATLVIEPQTGESTRLPMNASLDDPVFGARIPIVDQPLDYHVELGGQTTPKYKISVFEYPRLERADAKLVYPAYTGLEPRLIQDVRTVSAVEGTALTIVCRLNKPVTSAVLNDTRKDTVQKPIKLTVVSEGEPTVVQATLTMTESRRLALNLVDDAGRANTQQAQFSIHVLPNQPPSLKPTFPARDLEVSALEEVDVKATVYDDIGLVRHGLAYSLAGQEPVEVVLGERAAAKQKHELAHVVRLEALQAEPDQLLSYHWWAEDHGPDGQVRRTESDMYFAEVRPFEEIYRQGQQPPGGEQQQRQQQGQGQNAQDAQQLAQLQKEIINATWKLIRREIGEKLTEAFASDAEQVQLSQASAIEQAGALAQRLTDEQSQGHIEAVLTHMTGAAGHLKAAHDGPAAAPLKAALAEEQAALQALLKLRAREHEVVRQQQRQRGSQSQRQNQARSRQQQQQLNELDLNNEQNRYETQRTAQEQQEESAADRENRQVLNRLRELARRQHDLNERLKELQSALEEARTEEQKEEIRRQLKRLQEEQREILQNTDELQSRLEQPENAERMAEERQQLDETRDNVRRASESLEQEQVTRAAASGTRAEQQFEDLREEFRRRAANRFTEEVQQMRQAAQQLDERQQDLSQRLNESSGEQRPATDESPKASGGREPPEAQGEKKAKSRSGAKTRTKSLRDDDQRERIAEGLSQQRERLAQLQNQMRDTIMEAEETEPLLSERLYDAARGVQERQLDQTLQSAERSVRQGLAQDAQQQEQAAGEGIRQLREGIEEASEAVLGDETEALRQARERLDDLSRELDQEIERNGGDQQQASERRQPGESQRQNPQPQQGQQSDQEQQPGQQQQGQQQQGQQQQGQQQQGQQQQGQQQQGQQQQGQQLGQQQDGQRRLGDPQNQERRAGANEGNNNERRFNPLTGGGEEFRGWSDRLRDVEEMVQDPELRAEAARIRERARALRAEFKRHSDEPNWDLVQQQVAGPLFELRDRVVEELLRRTAKKAIVPLDRDPVPPEYAEKTRRYYEQLGGGR